MYLVTGYKNFFGLKELQIKMSSSLNVSNSSAKPEEFNLSDTEVVVDSEGENWFKRSHVGNFLGLPQIEKLLVGLDKSEIPVRKDFDPSHTTDTGWPRPKDHQNETDKFLSVFGVRYVIVNSQKDKGKALKKYILKDIVPRRFDARIEEIQEKHRQAIEEKDAAISLLNDDLKNREYDNKALQAQKDVYKDQLQNVKISLPIFGHVM